MREEDNDEEEENDNNCDNKHADGDYNDGADDEGVVVDDDDDTQQHREHDNPDRHVVVKHRLRRVRRYLTDHQLVLEPPPIVQVDHSVLVINTSVVLDQVVNVEKKERLQGDVLQLIGHDLFSFPYSDFANGKIALKRQYFCQIKQNSSKLMFFHVSALGNFV